MAHLPELQINKEHAKELIVSIKNAPLKKEVIKKDKSSERQNIPQWQATHFSDAFDNYYFWKYSDFKDGGDFVPTVFT
jgi:hypothetical protein